MKQFFIAICIMLTIALTICGPALLASGVCWLFFPHNMTVFFISFYGTLVISLIFYYSLTHRVIRQLIRVPKENTSDSHN